MRLHSAQDTAGQRSHFGVSPGLPQTVLVPQGMVMDSPERSLTWGLTAALALSPTGLVFPWILGQ
jgi:hypothetical protein